MRDPLKLAIVAACTVLSVIVARTALADEIQPSNLSPANNSNPEPRMPNLSSARNIAKELEGSAAKRQNQKFGLAVMSTLLNFIPVAGGAFGRMVDEVGTRFVDPDLEAKFVEICKLLADLEPQLAKIDNLDAGLQAVTQTIQRNEAVLKRVEAFADSAFPSAKKFNATNIASRQEFVDVTITNMKAVFSTTAGGTTVLDGVQTKGEDVDFLSKDGGSQLVRGSQFSGQGGSVVLDNLQVQGVVGTRTKEGSAIGFGPGGSIGFGPGGMIGFGPPDKK